MTAAPVGGSTSPASPDVLQASEARYRELAEALPIQIWTSLPNGQLDYVTEQTARSFGLTVGDLLLHGWKDVVHPDDLPLAVQRWTHALATGETYEVEFRLKRADGSYAEHLARAICQRAEDGTILRWLGTNTDIETQREERRRVQALLDAVAEQAVESARALRALQDQNAQAHARIAALEAQLHKP